MLWLLSHITAVNLTLINTTMLQRIFSTQCFTYSQIHSKSENGLAFFPTACTVRKSTFIFVLVCFDIAVSAVSVAVASSGSVWVREMVTQRMWHLLRSCSRIFSSFMDLQPLTNELCVLSFAYWRHKEQYISLASLSHFSQSLSTPLSPKRHFSENFLLDAVHWARSPSSSSSLCFLLEGWVTPGRYLHMFPTSKLLC